MSDYGACLYVDEPSEVWVVSCRVAAKVHSCCECEGLIAVGERHEVVSSLYAGQWFRDRTCAACVRGPLAFVERNCGTAREIGGLFAHLADVYSERLLQSAFAEGMVSRWIDESHVRAREARSVR